MQNKIPYVFNRVRGSTVDGEGIRSVIFMQGCPLRCQWCHNPESWNFVKHSFQNTPMNTESLPKDKEVVYYSVKELVEWILRDRTYYDVSHGGVTFSGGEPLSHISYVGEVARILYDEGITTIFETCGYFDYDSFENHVLHYTHTLLYDIKIIDEQQHIQYTGKSNTVILENLEKLSHTGLNIIPRTPLIPGITDTYNNLAAITRILRSLRLEDKHLLLPYNPYRNK